MRPRSRRRRWTLPARRRSRRRPTSRSTRRMGLVGVCGFGGSSDARFAGIPAVGARARIACVRLHADVIVQPLYMVASIASYEEDAAWRLAPVTEVGHLACVEVHWVTAVRAVHSVPLTAPTATIASIQATQIQIIQIACLSNQSFMRPSPRVRGLGRPMCPTRAVAGGRTARGTARG